MNFPFFVVLLAFYPILFIAASNPGQVPEEALVVSLAAAALGSLVLIVLLRLLLRSWAHAALGSAAVLVVFYAYGPIHTAIEFSMIEWTSSTTSNAVPSAILARLHTTLTAFAAVVVGGSLAAVRQTRPPLLASAIRGLNFFALILLVFVSVQWWFYSDGRSTVTSDSHPTVGKQTGILGYNPDIYIIVMDGYARADVLTAHYRFDNTPFLDKLRLRGFHISSRSTSNYHWTFLSLASALNMEYLQTMLGQSVPRESRNRYTVNAILKDNAVMRFLAARGYRTYHLQSTWGPTIQNEHADVNVPCHKGLFSDDFIRTVVDASWLKTLQSRLNTDLASCHLSNWATLEKLGSSPGPKLVFAHFLPPHHPYLFDSEGRILRHATFSNQFQFQRQLWEDRGQYIEQLQFVNLQMLRVVDGILATSPRPPVITLISDHGPNISRGLSQTDVFRVRFASFRALFLPGTAEGLPWQSLSLVNLYRHLLDYYFEAGLEMLPSRYYTSPFERPYDFREVSSDSVTNSF